MPHMTKDGDVLDVQDVLVDAMKAKGWKPVPKPQPSKGDKPKENKNNG